MEIATAGNASADRTIVETATVSDAEKLTKPREEASEESERDLTEEPLLDDLSPIASVSNAEYQPALCAPQISVVVPTQMLFVIEPDGSCAARKRKSGKSRREHGFTDLGHVCLADRG
ncbi:MAG: hypothetical protein ACLTF6_10305 [Clostridium sp.]